MRKKHTRAIKPATSDENHCRQVVQEGPYHSAAKQLMETCFPFCEAFPREQETVSPIVTSAVWFTVASKTLGGIPQHTK